MQACVHEAEIYGQRFAKYRPILNKSEGFGQQNVFPPFSRSQCSHLYFYSIQPDRAERLLINLIIGEGKTMSIRGVNVFLRWVRWVMLYR
jgi:hypothetical protein